MNEWITPSQSYWTSYHSFQTYIHYYYHLIFCHFTSLLHNSLLQHQAPHYWVTQIEWFSPTIYYYYKRIHPTSPLHNQRDRPFILPRKTNYPITIFHHVFRIHRCRLVFGLLPGLWQADQRRCLLLGSLSSSRIWAGEFWFWSLITNDSSWSWFVANDQAKQWLLIATSVRLSYLEAIWQHPST
jgi:hypothetical protein